MTVDLWSEPGDPGRYERAERRWRELAHDYGWRRSGRRYPLPRSLAHCGWMFRDPWSWPLVDHPRKWTNHRGDPVLTLEPYTDGWWKHPDRVLPVLLPQFREVCRTHDLCVEVADRSPYWPGRTTLLVVGPAVARPLVPTPWPPVIPETP